VLSPVNQQNLTLLVRFGPAEDLDHIWILAIHQAVVLIIRKFVKLFVEILAHLHLRKLLLSFWVNHALLQFKRSLDAEVTNEEYIPLAAETSLLQSLNIFFLHNQPKFDVSDNGWQIRRRYAQLCLWTQSGPLDK